MSAAGYASAVMGVADVLTGASADAAYEAAYGKFYSAYRGMHNAANQKVAAEANIAAITQDRVNTDAMIALKQDQTAARVKVAAAVSGTEGQSVDSVMLQTEINSSVAQSNNRKTSEQQIENQLSSVYQSQSTMLELDNTSVYTPSMGMALGKGLATIIGDDSLRGDVMDGIDGLFTSE